MIVLFTLVIWLLPFVSFLTPITRGHSLELGILLAAIALFLWVAFRTAREMRRHQRFEVGVISIVVALLPLFPLVWITVAKVQTYSYDDTVERYGKVLIGTTLDEVNEIFSGYKMAELAAFENNDSFQHIYVKLRWWKGPDNIYIYYEKSRVVGKSIEGSDAYPVSDFPILGVAESNKALNTDP